LAEAEAVVLTERRIPGRERDVGEVRNYYRTLQQIEAWVAQQAPITEAAIRRLHALIFTGPRARPTPYRDGQNVIRDAATGAIVYMPPDAGDVPGLMGELVSWLSQAGREGLPAPVIAGLAHYQFVTIHPFYDGNGRTARALATGCSTSTATIWDASIAWKKSTSATYLPITQRCKRIPIITIMKAAPLPI
jgi:Fic family protein